MIREKPAAHHEEAAHEMRHATLQMDTMIHQDDLRKVLANARHVESNGREGSEVAEDDMTSFQIGDTSTNYYEPKQQIRKGSNELLKMVLIGAGLLASGGMGAAIPLIMQALSSGGETVKAIDTDTQYEIGLE